MGNAQEAAQNISKFFVQIFYYFFIQMSNFHKLARKFTKRLEIVYKSSIMMNIQSEYTF